MASKLIRKQSARPSGRRGTGIEGLLGYVGCHQRAGFKDGVGPVWIKPRAHLATATVAQTFLSAVSPTFLSARRRNCRARLVYGRRAGKNVGDTADRNVCATVAVARCTLKPRLKASRVDVFTITSMLWLPTKRLAISS